MWFGNTYLRRIFQDLFHYHFALHCLIDHFTKDISIHKNTNKIWSFSHRNLNIFQGYQTNQEPCQGHRSASQSWSSIHALLMSPQPDLYQDHQVCSISRSSQLDKCQGHHCLTNVKVTLSDQCQGHHCLTNVKVTLSDQCQGHPCLTNVKVTCLTNVKVTPVWLMSRSPLSDLCQGHPCLTNVKVTPV